MNTCCLVLFVMTIKVSFGQGNNKERFCYFTAITKDISCKTNELLYVTEENYGIANYDNKTCLGLDPNWEKFLYTPRNTNSYLTTALNCNGRTNCTIFKNELHRFIKLFFPIIQNRTNLQNLSFTNIALEVIYLCLPDTLVLGGCNETFKNTSATQVYLLAKQIPLHCMCMIQGSGLTVRVVHWQNDHNVFSVSDNSGQCIIEGSQQYNYQPTCRNTSTLHVTINNDRYQSNWIWLRFKANYNISVSCVEHHQNTMTTPITGRRKVTSGHGNYRVLADYYVYIIASISAVIILLCISIAIYLHRRKRSNLNIKNLEKESRAEQRLYDYSDITTLNEPLDNLGNNQEPNYNTGDYNHLSFSERQYNQNQNQEQNGNLYDTQADYNHLSFSGHARPKPPNDLHLYDTTSDSDYNRIKLKRIGENVNPNSAEYDHAPISKP